MAVLQFTYPVSYQWAFGCFQLCAIAISTAMNSLEHASVCGCTRFWWHYDGPTWLGWFIVRVVDNNIFTRNLVGRGEAAAMLGFMHRRLG